MCAKKKKQETRIAIHGSNSLNSFLSEVLSDLKSGNIDIAKAKAITQAADKINKNNLNSLDYKKITGSDKPLPFFEEKEV